MSARGDKHEQNFKTLIDLAIKYDKPIRIGVNWGSLDQNLLAKMMEENNRQPNPENSGEILRRALVKSAIDSADEAVRLGMPKEQIAISAKVSGVRELVDIYQKLDRLCPYSLHLGLTEAGMGLKGHCVLYGGSFYSFISGHRRYNPRLSDAGTRTKAFCGSRFGL